MACTHIDSRELFVQFALNPALDIWNSAYCNGDYRACVRYLRLDTGICGE